MFGNGALHACRQSHQVVEQFLVRRRFVLQARGDTGQSAFSLRQHGPKFFGHRQAAQGHQSVGFDLEQALRNAPGPRLARAQGGHHQHALKAVIANPKFGKRARMSVAQQRSHHLRAPQPVARLVHQGAALRQVAVHHGQRHRSYRGAGNAAQPLGRQRKLGAQVGCAVHYVR